jgi:putative membrane protein
MARRLGRTIVGIALLVALTLGLIGAFRGFGLDSSAGSQIYQWVKAFHVIAVIAWMAGMLYLPRLFVYHCDAEVGSRQSETFKVMERRLLRGIINPSMVVSWALGLTMAYDGNWMMSPWFVGKLLLVVVMSAIHGMLVRWTADFAADRNQRSPLFFRIVNEVPAVLMVGIVLLVVIKPF